MLFNITGNLATGAGNIQVYNNSILLSNGTSPRTNITQFNDTGTFNITAEIANQNWSYNSETWWVEVNSRTPLFSNAVNDTGIKKHQNITMNITITGNLELRNYTFSWNDTGSFVNSTPFQISGALTSWDANTSRNITANGTYIVSWRYYACDISNNCNSSGLYNFTVANTLPTHSTPILNSTDGSNDTNQNLTVYNQSTSDVDGNSMTNIIDWRLNGSSYAVLNMPFDTNNTGQAGNPIRDYSLNVYN